MKITIRVEKKIYIPNNLQNQRVLNILLYNQKINEKVAAFHENELFS